MKQLLLFAIFIFSIHDVFTQTVLKIPVAGNAFLTSGNTDTASITDEGIVNWRNAASEFSIYFRADASCVVSLGFGLQKANDNALLTTINNKKYLLHVSGDSTQQKFIQDNISLNKGYTKVVVSGAQKQGEQFAQVKNLLIKTTLPDSLFHYVKENSGNRFYWGRRGPSVHLSYDIPTQKNIEWFYSELTVPKNGDAVGSYFMADGFKEGYFGMQVNSKTERRILFSIWSPYKTDNPNNIPDSERIIMLKKGADVHVGEFGDEGSGGQSYLLFPWKAGSTYRFLLHATPAKNNYTDYTAYFYAPEKNQWMLIASFSRPKTNTYLTHLHSFLENFIDTNGYLTRFCNYGNQWVVDTNDKWYALTKATFTGDDIAKVHYRMDYKAGTHSNSFYLQNGGFFNNYTTLNKQLMQAESKVHPYINFNKLPE